MSDSESEVKIKGKKIWHKLANSRGYAFDEYEKSLAEFRVITRDKGLDITSNLHDDCLMGLTQFTLQGHIEAQKCISNIILNYPETRSSIIGPYMQCVEIRLTQALLDDKESSKNTPISPKSNEMLYYDLRIIFLLSALCPNSRSTIRDKLCEPIFSLININLKHYPTNVHDLIVEALKTLFNLTMEECISPSLAEIVIKSLLDETEDCLLKSEFDEKRNELLANVINLLTNMPQSIYLSLSEENAKKIINYLDYQLKKEQSIQSYRDSVLPALNCCKQICKYNGSIRLMWFEQIIGTIKDFEKRPEQYDTIRGRLVKLMTSVDVLLKDMAADFLYCLCDKDAEKLITYTGLGNAASFLSTKGLLGEQASSEKSSANGNRLHDTLRQKIDPITGMLERPKQNSVLDNMTESEKEYHAEELANAISRLANLGVISPIQIDSHGKLSKIMPENNNDSRHN